MEEIIGYNKGKLYFQEDWNIDEDVHENIEENSLGIY